MSVQNVYLRFHPDFFQRNEFARLFVQSFVHDTVRPFADLFQLVIIDIDADVPRRPFLDEIPCLQRALQQLYTHYTKKYIQTHTCNSGQCGNVSPGNRANPMAYVPAYRRRLRDGIENLYWDDAHYAGVAKNVGDNQEMAVSGSRTTQNE